MLVLRCWSTKRSFLNEYSTWLSLVCWWIEYTLFSLGVKECNTGWCLNQWSNPTHACLSNVDEWNICSSLPKWNYITSANLSTNEAIQHILVSRMLMNWTHARLSRSERMQHLLISQRMKLSNTCLSLECWWIEHTLFSLGVKECNTCWCLDQRSNQKHSCLSNVDEWNICSSLPKWNYITSAHLSTNEAIQHILVSRMLMNGTYARLSRSGII
jgi:hypothetical protein